MRFDCDEKPKAKKVFRDGDTNLEPARQTTTMMVMMMMIMMMMMRAVKIKSIEEGKDLTKNDFPHKFIPITARSFLTIITPFFYGSSSE